MIEVGMHKNLKIHERICQVCKKNVEDEIHFLLNCKLYDEMRNPLYQLSTEENFPYYIDKGTLIFMMTSSIITLEVAKVPYKTFNIRDDNECEINDFGEYND